MMQGSPLHDVEEEHRKRQPQPHLAFPIGIGLLRAVSREWKVIKGIDREFTVSYDTTQKREFL
jgi:hypothetical protein